MAESRHRPFAEHPPSTERSLLALQPKGPDWRIPKWYPINDQQYSAIHSDAELLLYGGGSGGGKTDLLVADACKEWENPTLRALLIRRSFTEMHNIKDRCAAIYKPMGAKWNGEDHIWAFPTGAQVRLGFMKENGDVTHHQGIPFSVLLVDESTFLPEKAIRDLLPWLAVPNPQLHRRVRLATNPGEIGADWHIQALLKGHCPIHNPEQSVRPGEIRRRGAAKWGDGVPIPLTTQFIPSLAKDNPLYGQHKIDLLQTQTAERRERLLTGCWCALTGRYFAFLSPDHRRPYAEAGEQWWYTFIISIDYGFGESWAAAGLYCITEPNPQYPEGQMFKIAEMEEKEMGSVDFARQVCREWVEPIKAGGQRRRIVTWYYDPAMDSHTGTGKSNKQIMDEVFQQYDIPAIASAKDRIGNAQNLYNMLKYQQVVVCDTAPKTFNSLNTRMHDPKKPGDIKKVSGDVMDDYYDETSYAANTYFESPVKPKDIAFLERMKSMKEAGATDHTLWMEQQRRLLEQNLKQDDDEPIYLGRPHRKRILHR
jgi:hypothetical protein